MAARPVQAPEPEQKRAETAPAPKAPAMTLPDPKSKPQTVKNAPRDAASKAPTTGPELTEGTARSSERKRGQGFAGLSGGGGGDSSGVTLDVADFCCQDYIILMKETITRNWNGNKGRVGVTTMKFTIRRDGRLERIQLEEGSGFTELDQEAERALRVTRLDSLPGRYPNETLTVHLQFVYEKQ
jgi:TonB family protein